MCSLKLPLTVIEIIDKHRKNYLWRGKDFNSKRYNLAAWDLVRKPKSKGGLGVVNLSIQNDALLLKQLHKFYSKADIQWVALIWQKYYNNIVPYLTRERGSFWWKDIFRLHTQFRGVATCNPNRGDTVSFWEDIIDGVIHFEKFPHLLHFARDPAISLFALRSTDNLLNCFRIPMTRAAYNEFLELQAFLNYLPPISPGSKDSWHLIWGQRRFLSSHFYQYQFRELRPSKAILDIWKTKCIPRIKFFAWLLLNDRLNTRNILRRRRKVLDEGYNCVMCHNSEEETAAHLFFSCPAAVNRWFALGVVWGEI
jgi:hypothetical protein